MMDHQEQDSKDFFEQIRVEESSNIQNNRIRSQHINNYLELMKISQHGELNRIKQSSLQKLKEKKLIAGQQWHIEGLNFDIVSYSSNYQCLVLKVCYGIFNFIITLIFVQDISPLHQKHISFSGNFSTVYQAKICQQQIAIKCTCFEIQNFKIVFRRVLTQYLIFVIASQLQCGPKVQKSLGFDLIIYDNCIQFSMEYCTPSCMEDQPTNLVNDLINDLRIMHSLRIIHFDIKPENIMYSPQYRKYIFIDYGEHHLCSQELGLKTYTSFRGSAPFCSEEMTRCLRNNRLEYVDLYYNDAFCLEQSIINLKESTTHLEYRRQPKTQQAVEIQKYLTLILAKAIIINKWLVFKLQKYPYNKVLQSFTFPNQKLKQLEHFEQTFSRKFKPSFRHKLPAKAIMNHFIHFHNEVDIQEQTDTIYNSIKQQHFKKKKEMINKVIKGNPHLTFLLNGKLESTQIQNLSIFQFCLKLSKDHYLILLSRYLYFFNLKVARHQKQKICDIFNQLYLKLDSYSKLPIQTKLYHGYKYMIQQAIMKKQLSNLSFQLIKNTLSSIVFFEVISYEELLNIIQDILCLKAPILRKIRVFIIILKSAFWVKLKLKSKFCYLSLLQFLYKKWQQIVSIMKNSMNSVEAEMINNLKDIVQNKQVDKVFAKLEEKIQLKPYLYHAMTNDHELVLVELHSYNQLDNYLSLNENNNTSFMEMVLQTFQKSIIYQKSFEFEQLKIFLDISEFKQFHDLLIQYNFSLHNFINTLVFNILKINGKRELSQGIKVNLDISNYKLSQIALQYTYLVLRFKFFRFIFLKLHKSSDRSDFHDEIQLLQQLSDKNFIQMYIQTINRQLSFRHIHSLRQQICILIYFLNKLASIIPSVYPSSYKLEVFKKIQLKIVSTSCIECKVQSLFYLNNFQISIEDTFQAKDFFISAIILMVKLKAPIKTIACFILNYMTIMKKEMDHIFDSEKLILFYEVTKIYNFDYFIYMCNTSAQSSQQKPLTILQITLVQFWKIGEELYFEFLQNLIYYGNNIVNSHYNNHLKNIWIYEIYNSTCKAVTIQMILDGKFQLIPFFAKNLSFYLQRLRKENNQILAIYLYAISHFRPKKFPLQSIFFMYIWLFAANKYSFLCQRLYFDYFYYKMEAQEYVAARKKIFLWRERMKALLPNQNKSTIMKQRAQIKIDFRYGRSAKKHKRMFHKKIGKYLSYAPRSQS